jgi:hypothetical protein
MNPIVVVNVSQVQAPTPNNLQKLGALLSQGGTTLAAGEDQLLTRLGDLTPILAAARPLTTLTWTGNVATATVHGFAIDSGTYNSSTGAVVLTLHTASTFSPSDSVFITGAAGTGSFASLNGSQTATAGTTGVTLKFTIATGLTLTISAGGFAYVPHGVTPAATFLTTIAGATPTVYNGAFTATATNAYQFTYALVGTGLTSPATGTITYLPQNAVEIVQMATKFFAQGNTQSVYVLELGASGPTAAIAELVSYVEAQPAQPFYAYLVPRNWDGVADYLALLSDYESDTSKTYFFTTTTLANFADYTALMKDVFWMVQAPGTDTTEFSCAAPFYDWLNYSPSTTDKVTPFAFTYLFGVTPYPLKNNAVTLAEVQAAYGNVVGTGAEGGISTAILQLGTTADGRDATYWYSVDWVQINAYRRLSNAVINGSNNRVNPLYLNQNGVDRLQAVLVGLMNSGVSYGLVLGSVVQTALTQDDFNAAFDRGDFAGRCVVNAIPFTDYYSLNPSDFEIGKYAGFSIIYTPNRGFTQIVVNIVVTDFVAP